MGFSLPANWFSPVITPVMTIVLFVSLIPLLYASEKLPKNTLLEKQLKKHLEKSARDSSGIKEIRQIKTGSKFSI